MILKSVKLVVSVENSGGKLRSEQRYVSHGLRVFPPKLASVASLGQLCQMPRHKFLTGNIIHSFELASAG